MERVVIAGCPGAGKSTAARRLAEITGLPVVHLDRHYWQPGWTRPDPEDWQETVSELAARPRWIMDGNYGSTLNLRLAAADTLIHLDFSTFVCASRVLRRTLTGLGGQRGGELGDGCQERLDWPFFQFVLNYRRTRRDRDLEVMSGFGGTVYRMESPRQLESLFRLFAKRPFAVAEI
ncbi:adenylate kinase [Devosia nitrariae]|nr:adenylate kinase [Devosia nitrariae]